MEVKHITINEYKTTYLKVRVGAKWIEALADLEAMEL